MIKRIAEVVGEYARLTIAVMFFATMILLFISSVKRGFLYPGLIWALIGATLAYSMHLFVREERVRQMNEEFAVRLNLLQYSTFSNSAAMRFALEDESELAFKRKTSRRELESLLSEIVKRLVLIQQHSEGKETHRFELDQLMRLYIAVTLAKEKPKRTRLFSLLDQAFINTLQFLFLFRSSSFLKYLDGTSWEGEQTTRNSDEHKIIPPPS